MQAYCGQDLFFPEKNLVCLNYPFLNFPEENRFILSRKGQSAREEMYMEMLAL